MRRFALAEAGERIAKANDIEGVSDFDTPGLSESQKTRAALARPLGIARTMMSMAGTILDYAVDEVDSVIAGGTPFDVAYKEARTRKEKGLSTESRMERLQAADSDLAAMVAEERLTLKAAETGVDRARRFRDDRRRRSRERVWLKCAWKFLGVALVVEGLRRSRANWRSAQRAVRPPDGRRCDRRSRRRSSPAAGRYCAGRSRSACVTGS
jgi:hypothetical protein